MDFVFDELANGRVMTLTVVDDCSKEDVKSDGVCLADAAREIDRCRTWQPAMVV